MTDPFVIDTVRPAQALRRRRGAARADPAGARRIDLRLPRPQRRRQDHDDQGPARHGAPDQRQRARLRPAGRRAGAERRDPPPHRLRQRRQGSLRLHDRRRDDPLHRRLLPALARRPRAALPPHVRAAADRKIKALSRGMRTKLALLLALVPRRRAADPRRADLGPRSGDDRGGAAGAGRATSPARR